MPHPNVKIIKGSGPTLSLAQLERASAKLLISRIRGHEPQVSFTFIQRLLDELIRRRRDEELTKIEINGIVADMEKSAEAPSEPDDADFETLMSADVEVIESIDTTSGRSKSDELEIPEEVVLDEDSPLVSMVAPTEEEDDEAEEPIERSSRPARRRSSVVACSRRQTALSELNVWRVLIAAALVAIAMVFGVLLLGCDPS